MTLTDFTQLGLSPRIVARLDALGITTPTPIQEGAIPHALEGRDVLGLAQTGTGKTNAFGLPILEILGRDQRRPGPRQCRGLILAPTRELAGQIRDGLAALTEGTRMKVVLVVGGMSINRQINALVKGADLIIATPGRLIDLMDRRAVDLSETGFLVLDEADQMLDLGFIHALRRIAPMLPKGRQTMLFSATMPKQMEEISRQYLSDPVRVQVAPPGKPADKVAQHVHYVAKTEKLGLLIELLGAHVGQRALVFGRTKHGSEKLMKKLVEAGFAAASIHGNKSQGQRDRALKAFRAGEVTVLVATDVAARGIDIPEVEFVYNYELPNVPENYVHRIGRTARAGREGIAVAFCASDEMGELKAIEKLLKIELPVESGNRWPGSESSSAAKPSGGGRRRRRGGGGGGGGAPAAAKPKAQKSGGAGRSRRRGGGGGGRSRSAA